MSKVTEEQVFPGARFRLRAVNNEDGVLDEEIVTVMGVFEGCVLYESLQIGSRVDLEMEDFLVEIIEVLPPIDPTYLED